MIVVPLLHTAPLRRALRAACSPQHWHVQMQRQRQRAARLSQACGWLEEGPAKKHKRLLAQPLMGACLAELINALEGEGLPLTAVEGQEAVRPTAVRRREKLSPPEQKPRRPSAQPLVRLRPTSAGDRPAKATLNPGWPAKANLALLQRLAGARVGKAFLSPQAPRSIRTGHHLAGDPNRLSEGGGAQLESIRAAATAGPTRAKVYASRARRILKDQAVGAAPIATVGAALETGGSRPGALERQWDWPLNGATIAGEHLARLAGGLTLSVRAVRSTGQSQSKSGSSNALSQALWDSLPASLGGLSSPGQEKPRTGTTAGIRPSAGNGGAQASEEERPFPEAMSGGKGPDLVPHDPGESLASPAPRLSPPQLAATLPSLRPIQRPAQVLTPAAAFTAERSAQREALDTAPDDLDELADKLRRILEEEARRHGINV